MSSLEVPQSSDHPSGHGRTASIQAYIDVVKAAKQREKRLQGVQEVMQAAEQRKHDPVFTALEQELRQTKDTKIEKKARAIHDTANADIIAAATKAAEARAQLAEEQKIMKERQQDSTFKSLGKELKNVVSEKEFQYNNAKAREEINARQSNPLFTQLNDALHSNPMFTQINVALESEDKASKLRHIVQSQDDAIAAMEASTQ